MPASHNVGQGLNLRDTWKVTQRGTLFYNKDYYLLGIWDMDLHGIWHGNAKTNVCHTASCSKYDWDSHVFFKLHIGNKKLLRINLLYR